MNNTEAFMMMLYKTETADDGRDVVAKIGPARAPKVTVEIAHDDLRRVLAALRAQADGPMWFGLSKPYAVLSSAAERAELIEAFDPPTVDLATCSDEQFRQYANMHHDAVMHRSMAVTDGEEPEPFDAA